MQQRVNEVWLRVEGEEIVLKDVDVLEVEDGLFIEDSFVLGKTEDDEDIVQKRLTHYPAKHLVKMVWTENALVDKVKETVISELLADKFESLMDLYEDEEEVELPEPAPPSKDDPEFNPYKKEWLHVRPNRRRHEEESSQTIG